MLLQPARVSRGYCRREKLRFHFLEIAAVPGEILFGRADGFAVLLQASRQPFLCLRSLIERVPRTVQ